MLQYENCSQIGVKMENEKKLYHTAGRTALLSYLKERASEAPETADEIYRGLVAAGTAPGRSSVYRMLSELAESGRVRKSRASGAGYTYQLVSESYDCHGHLHLQCLSCGKVSHLKCDCSAEIAEHLLRMHGFAVDRGRSVLLGTCAACGEGKV